MGVNIRKYGTNRSKVDRAGKNTHFEGETESLRNGTVKYCKIVVRGRAARGRIDWTTDVGTFDFNSASNLRILTHSSSASSAV